METRNIGKTNLSVPVIGLGCWQLGGGWGNPWDDAAAQRILDGAVATGVRFFDTADVYGDGDSERSIGRYLRSHSEVTVATKLGRAGIFPDKYSRETLRAAVMASLERLGLEQIPLIQLHRIPPSILREGKVFEWLRELRQEGLIAHFGASVETMAEAMLCMEQDDLASLQIIFNLFRQKPIDVLLPSALERKVGIIVRLPLASGLLSGKINSGTVFREGDHRNFNRDGQHFNVGETFAGLELPTGIALAGELAAMVPAGMTMAQMALRWILDHEAVSVVIPGASSPAQAEANAVAASLPPLPAELHARLRAFYQDSVHSAIRGPY